MRKSTLRRDQYSQSPTSVANPTCWRSERQPGQFTGITLESETPGTPVLSAQTGKPLWVVDGIKVNPDFINKLDPSRIENITVLKDQSAVATYGQEARNGVVIITTKGDTALPTPGTPARSMEKPQHRLRHTTKRSAKPGKRRTTSRS